MRHVPLNEIARVLSFVINLPVISLLVISILSRIREYDIYSLKVQNIAFLVKLILMNVVLRLLRLLPIILRVGVKRESANVEALSSWKRAIFDIIDLRINFYKANTSLLPRKPKHTLRHLKKSIQEFHSKFAFVPADKASNNIILV